MKKFSEFPRHATSIALLLLRSSAAGLLVIEQCQVLPEAWDWATLLTSVLALLLLIGYATSVVSLTAVLAQACYIFMAQAHRTPVSIALLAICLSIAPLGAGAYSLDGFLYGRRRVIL